MLFFILVAGKAVQCASQTGCVPVPYEAVAYMVQFGILELVMEIATAGGIVRYYKKKVRKDDEDE